MEVAIIIFFLTWLWVPIALATHLVLSIIVFKDAKSLTSTALNISPVLWLAVSLIIPIIGMFIYWVMNHSQLSNKNYRL
ncbi:MAG: hypothetical protein K9L17_07165 [Clostridiales bacterium]|nr:hypothetical protein [Clostridiales bacterium]MCF8022452.1 hypothetical protein [Clostridiales bacterium]